MQTKTQSGKGAEVTVVYPPSRTPAFPPKPPLITEYAMAAKAAKTRMLKKPPPLDAIGAP